MQINIKHSIACDRCGKLEQIQSAQIDDIQYQRDYSHWHVVESGYTLCDACFVGYDEIWYKYTQARDVYMKEYDSQ